ncbi:hypothetical protein CIHG_02924 [Coccidioides immitis H538.4]|uniref:Uncharacterized protein n=3 Tax=Coccidioides immitis TaxID=5501 RepID=A0A0J8R5M4_COCIT|nr:hypothetical protein CIRG_07633 [Coccidioides immitis RMSCC 2394]KMU79013.1 hypothetical protein CISG_07320 [Coccidioides immitis RMSCC 3703]KMU85143.1 hypothetical protein CIHG_02924 [Coccidioides immitis H538.4]
MSKPKRSYGRVLRRTIPASKGQKSNGVGGTLEAYQDTSKRVNPPQAYSSLFTALSVVVGTWVCHTESRKFCDNCPVTGPGQAIGLPIGIFVGSDWQEFRIGYTRSIHLRVHHCLLRGRKQINDHGSSEQNCVRRRDE